jgi:hypothetical protein
VIKAATPGPIHDRLHDLNANLQEPRIFAKLRGQERCGVMTLLATIGLILLGLVLVSSGPSPPEPLVICSPLGAVHATPLDAPSFASSCLAEVATSRGWVVCWQPAIRSPTIGLMRSKKAVLPSYGT